MVQWCNGAKCKRQKTACSTPDWRVSRSHARESAIFTWELPLKTTAPMRRVLRRLLRRGKKDEEPPPPPLPSLPDADREAWTADQQRQSLFFCLPAEIRHGILCAAFGDRTVHIDLRLRPRLYTAETAEGCSPSRFHAGYPPLLTRWDMGLRPGIDVRTKDDKKLAWRWYGCVCHHNKPGHAGNQPYNDACLRGHVRGCSDHPGNVPEKCMVGAMGYLRSCKRA